MENMLNCNTNTFSNWIILQRVPQYLTSSKYENIQTVCCGKRRNKKADIINPEWFIRLAGLLKHRKKEMSNNPPYISAFTG